MGADLAEKDLGEALAPTSFNPSQVGAFCCSGLPNISYMFFQGMFFSPTLHTRPRSSCCLPHTPLRHA